jgi:hypothetical protein
VADELRDDVARPRLFVAAPRDGPKARAGLTGVASVAASSLAILALLAFAVSLVAFLYRASRPTSSRHVPAQREVLGALPSSTEGSEGGKPGAVGTLCYRVMPANGSRQRDRLWMLWLRGPFPIGL